jgi:hypothetical protein
VCRQQSFTVAGTCFDKFVRVEQSRLNVMWNNVKQILSTIRVSMGRLCRLSVRYLLQEHEREIHG